MRGYLQHLDAFPDATSRSCRGGHLTASALVWQVSATGPRVLLTLHARIGRWLQMGGHIESSDADLAAAALREAQEESGIRTLTLSPWPLRLDRHEVACRDGEQVDRLDHLDVQYLALAPDQAREERSEESTDLRWFDVREGRIVGCEVDDSVARLITAAWSVGPSHQ